VVFLVLSIIYLVRSTIWLAFGATTCQQELFVTDDDVTSLATGCRQMVTSGLQVTSWSKTSHPDDHAQRMYCRGVEPLYHPKMALLLTSQTSLPHKSL